VFELDLIEFDLKRYEEKLKFIYIFYVMRDGRDIAQKTCQIFPHTSSSFSSYKEV